MRKPWRASPAAAACALLFGMTGCTADAPLQAIESPHADSSAVAVERSDPSHLRFGQPYQFANGLSVTVSEPRSFTPSEAAYPSAERAVSFGVWIRNESERPYRLSGMSIAVAVNGEPAQEIVDPAHGFNGIAGADTDVATARDVMVTLAFAISLEADTVTLDLQPELTNPESAFYVGGI